MLHRQMSMSLLDEIPRLTVQWPELYSERSTILDVLDCCCAARIFAWIRHVFEFIRIVFIVVEGCNPVEPHARSAYFRGHAIILIVLRGLAIRGHLCLLGDHNIIL